MRNSNVAFLIYLFISVIIDVDIGIVLFLDRTKSSICVVALYERAAVSKGFLLRIFSVLSNFAMILTERKLTGIGISCICFIEALMSTSQVEVNMRSCRYVLQIGGMSDVGKSNWRYQLQDSRCRYWCLGIEADSSWFNALHICMLKLEDYIICLIEFLKQLLGGNTVIIGGGWYKNEMCCILVIVMLIHVCKYVIGSCISEKILAICATLVPKLRLQIMRTVETITRVVPADLVVVGIEIHWNTILFESQLSIEKDGIRVNEKMQTSNSPILAVGEVAAFTVNCLVKFIA
ncbi:monodehydroascorbate reductase 4, peroxisomal-like [Chenopodium quinoa]|uniref:monodehydroascorbate reductase 4, peroxisomal-like n=1 Tax=Chenopodium quinoa TaxID=63459 RepID=UPI000B78286E|nr:monodehydroascorbate reductase 4, peroxisomal-like [Chenopodium quinoa]